jgi:hypothetical protein
MDYHLPAHSSFAALGSRVVFLDVQADRYFLLRGTEASAVLEARPDASVWGESLIARDLLRAGPGNAVRPVSVIAPTSSALESSDVEGGLWLAELAYFRAEASLLLRLAGLQSTFDRLRRYRRRSARSGHRDAVSTCADRASAGCLARGFARARIFVPAARLCVPDSMALARSLWRRGIDADLYFGVRLDPFAAHCWLQHDDLLLTDPMNFVADYTPVFKL